MASQRIERHKERNIRYTTPFFTGGPKDTPSIIKGKPINSTLPVANNEAHTPGSKNHKGGIKCPEVLKPPRTHTHILSSTLTSSYLPTHTYPPTHIQTNPFLSSIVCEMGDCWEDILQQWQHRCDCRFKNGYLVACAILWFWFVSDCRFTCHYRCRALIKLDCSLDQGSVADQASVTEEDTIESDTNVVRICWKFVLLTYMYVYTHTHTATYWKI